ncbi:MAG: DUF2161 family putative PD-(D/E)XK-type phosphodiesterase [Thermoanaerobaculia bacterium]|nr:DUF2161 family putative PD-(D/E)XK-type phosphodiesterase [Thermoanaerobaculia bacterium]
MKESDLYPPVKRFLESQGYEAKGEVQDCDVVAIRGTELPVVVELKRSLIMNVMLQAVDRLLLTPKVYVGVPKRCASLSRQRKRVVKLFRMLGLGLLAIDCHREPGSVEVLLDPGAYRPRQSRFRQERLLGEFARRVGDPNLGGIEKRKGIMTAYRQRAVSIAQFLSLQGPTKASRIAQSLGEPQARGILYRDVYGWFDRVSFGVYALSPRGEEELSRWQGKPTTVSSESQGSPGSRGSE